MFLTDDFRSIVLNETALLDVRAPVEFAKGAFVNATNIAILNDNHRELIGTKYKEKGNAAAVELAQKLIGQEGKVERVQKWKNYLQKNPKALLYCFRGGQRSGISQSWLDEIGINITRLKGGYKDFRTFLMDETLRISKDVNTIIIGGRTGCGKTILIEKLDNAIDLEKLANHRGSTFGGFVSEQPSQINFENTLAYALIQFEDKNKKNLIIEHESHHIGKSFIPTQVYANLMDGKLIILEAPLEERVEIIFEDYIVNSLKKYQEKYQENAVSIWSESIANSLKKVQRKLGGELYEELKTIFENALSEHVETGNIEGYKYLIQRLLVKYYDPMYDYQLQKTTIEIVFKGNASEINNYLKHV